MGRSNHASMLPPWWFWLAVSWEVAIELVTTSFAKYLTQLAVKEGINFRAQLLPDLGHFLLPFEDQWTPWLADLFASSMIVMQFIMLGSLVVRGCGWPKMWRLFSWWLFLHGLLMFMRLTTMTVTVLPTPMETCRVAELFWASPECTRQLNDLWPSFSAFYCNDMMFSGHTALFQFCSYMWWCSPSTRFHNTMKVLNAVMAAVGTLFVLIDRYHYSADVLVATYITACLVYGFRDRIRACHSVPTVSSTHKVHQS